MFSSQDILEEFVEATRFNGTYRFHELRIVVEDPNKRQREYMRRKWREPKHREKRAAYFREYNTRPDRREKKRLYEANRRSRLRLLALN